uniref:hypothetical protein n=1 Tax=Microbulbifer agarilyticus TaxID=260552 RepID=UPI000255AA0C|nr:hypothetical protein [Microbulbifer agarilyticus]
MFSPVQSLHPCLRLLIIVALLQLVTACGGGSSEEDGSDRELTQTPPPSYAPGNGSDSSGSPPTPGSSGGTQAVPPGEYATLERCTPFSGSAEAPLKVIFANLDAAPYFDEIVQDSLENQFRSLAPFAEYQHQFGFYRVNLDGFSAQGCSRIDSGGFTCDEDKIHQSIYQQCGGDDLHGVIKIVIAEADFGASGGEVIYVASDRDWQDSATALYYLRNIVIHEVGHNFGLADLYDGGVNRDGSAVEGWPSELSREWANLDAPGCSKWCNNFKPASEYTQSESAVCPSFTDRSSCVAYNRSEAGECATDEDGNPTCCAWSSNNEDDYFASQCTPAWGTENIGQDCLQGTGCFYGGAYGNNSWRPAKTWEDSIMYGAGQSTAFDAASERALGEAMRCCGTSDDSTKSCALFRANFTTFMQDFQPYKTRLGSCGTR